jgi:superfamily II DNA/RNA helicase
MNNNNRTKSYTNVPNGQGGSNRNNSANTSTMNMGNTGYNRTGYNNRSYSNNNSSYSNNNSTHSNTYDESGYNRQKSRFKGIGGHHDRHHRSVHESEREMNRRFNYASMASDLLDREDILCSEEVITDARDKFEDMGDEEGLKEELLLGILAFGYSEPSRIQSYAIPQIIKRRDIIAQSQSGTGKTGAFVISALQVIDEKLNVPQAIILSPTSELAHQTFIVGKSLAIRMPNVKFSFTVGGSDMLNNIKELGGRNEIERDNELTSQIVIATPGRLVHLLREYPHLFEHIKLLIVDECDELLSRTFQDEIKTIIERLSDQVQICLFSATLSSDVVNLSSKILNNPIQILIKKEKMTLDGIKQTFIPVNNDNDKLNILVQLLQTIQVQQFIIYVNKIANTQILKNLLENENFSFLIINSTMSKYDRANIVREFKKGEIKCLISTDLLSRGIDIQQLSLVINYDLPHPDKIESYIHRIGRTGRYGKSGLAINLANKQEKDTLNLISLTFKCSIEPMKTSDLIEFNC